VQVDIRIDEIVLQALAETPELRFATAAQFRTRVEAARLPRTNSRWPAAKWAAVIGVLFAAAVGAETLRRSLDRPVPDPSGPHGVQNIPSKPANTVDEFKENLHRLLDLEKEIAIDAAQAEPGTPAGEQARRDRAQLLRTLQEHDRELRKQLGIPPLTEPSAR
jgi:hypothetical protein